MGKARDALLIAAEELFHQHGIGATGIDTVIDRAGVAKMSLYNHFGSKAELVAAYLRLRDSRWWERLERLSEGRSDVRERILAFFDGYRDSAVEDGFRGCPFINGASELVDPGHPGYRVIREHKRAITDRLRSLAHEAGAAEPNSLAWQLTLLLDGATTEANITKSAEPFSHARAAAVMLLDQLLGEPAPAGAERAHEQHDG